jgi:hypothetical protein
LWGFGLATQPKAGLLFIMSRVIKEIRKFTRWFASRFGEDLMKDIRVVIHCDRLNYDEFVEVIGHPMEVGGDSITIYTTLEDICGLGDLDSMAIQVYCEPDVEYFMLAQPDRSDWAEEEKSLWLEENN